MNAASKLWFYLSGTGESVQTHGPYDVKTMRGALPFTNTQAHKCAIAGQDLGGPCLHLAVYGSA